MRTLGAAAVLLVAACASSPVTPRPPSAGTLVSAEPVDAPDGVRAWRVLYHSRSIDDRDIEVSGLVLAPLGPIPAGGHAVVSWAHGTTGSADRCAPSRSDVSVTALSEIARRGYVVAATDYEGLGSEGPHPYLVGGSEARGVLDAARAALAIPEAGASRRLVVSGHSQGGHAALFAGEIARVYAPELDLRGVVAIAPASDLTVLIPGAAALSPALGFLVMVAYGWSAVYPEASLPTLLTDAALQKIGIMEEECLGAVLSAYGDRRPSEYVRSPPGSTEPWTRLLRENSAGSVASDAPVFVVQGMRDPLVPAFVTESFVRKACDAGTRVELRRYEAADHTSVLTASAEDVARWTADRFASRPLPSSCPS